MGNDFQRPAGNPAVPPPLDLLSKRQFRMYRLRVLLRALQLAYKAYPNLRDALGALRKLRPAIRENDRIRHITKSVRVGDRVFGLMSYPGGISPAQDMFILNELHNLEPIPGREQGMLLLLLAITKKCSLQCAHCFEWDQLNGREKLSLENIVHIISKFQSRGVAQIELSGGEPLNRFGDLLEILRRSDTTASDFWILTAGYRLNPEKALALKHAGLTGVAVSLDHWNAAEHDQFRGLQGSFDWACAALRNAREVGLVTGLSLTPVRSFCTEEHLFRYADLAKNLGAHFIRIIEPRSVGHFEGMNVELGPAELAVIESFARTMQRDKRYRDYPIIDYYGTFQREVGCSGGGKRYLYIDTDGDYHACPFCRNKCGNAVHDSIDEGIRRMQAACGCHAFETF